VLDPFGVRWMVCTRVRNVGTDDLAASAEEFARKGAQAGPLS
jgi:hypothetical protein